MKKVIASIILGIVFILSYLTISSACFIFFYQPELPKKE
jgi:cyclic lactone autoinducer peptide